nr:MAG TPA: hypothetical protein [Caudoviricetes sp.]
MLATNRGINKTAGQGTPPFVARPLPLGDRRGEARMSRHQKRKTRF